MSLIGVNIARFERLRRFVEERWGQRNPERAGQLTNFLRQRYLVEFGDVKVKGRRRLSAYSAVKAGSVRRRYLSACVDAGARSLRLRSYTEVIAQEAGRKRRAENRRVEGRHQFLRYLDLQEVHDDQAEIDLWSLARFAVGVSDSNRREMLFFTDLDRPEAPIVLAHEWPPWDQEDGPERTPGAIQLTLADAYWWCTSGRIAWFDGKWHPLTDEIGRPIRDAEGRPPFLTAYPGPDPGRIEAWRRGADMATWKQGLFPRPAKPRWDREEQTLWFGTVLCRKYKRRAKNQSQ
jgi:hypothetical protein